TKAHRKPVHDHWEIEQPIRPELEERQWALARNGTPGRGQAQGIVQLHGRLLWSPDAVSRPARITNTANPTAPAHRQAPKWSISTWPMRRDTPKSNEVQQSVAIITAIANWRRFAPTKPHVV